MKAIVLAAGYGTRLRPLTHRVPKPLVPVVGHPLIEHIITKLRRCKVRGIGVNVHHGAPALERYLAPLRSGMEIYISRESRILGVAGGIGGFREFLHGEECFIVHNGDILSDICLDDLVESCGSEPPLCAMVLHDRPGLNYVSVDEGGAIVDIRDTLRPAVPVRKLAYTGISIMHADILKTIPAGPCDLVPVLLDIIRKGRSRVQAIIRPGCAWQDIGTVSSYFQAHADVLVDGCPLVDESCRPDTPISLGEGSVREAGAALHGFVSAGKRCVFRSGCRLENCIVWDDVEIKPGEVFENAVVGSGWAVQVPSGCEPAAG